MPSERRPRRWARLRRATVSLLGVAVLSAASVASAGGLLGDTNCDDRVDQADFDALLAGLFGVDNGCPGLDVNGDKMISAADVVALLGVLPPPEPTATPTPTPVSPTATGTPATVTPTATGSVLASATATASPSVTAPPSATATPSITLTPGGPTLTPSRTGTSTSTPTNTHHATFTLTPTETALATDTPTATRTLTRTRTQTRTRTPSDTPSPGRTPSTSTATPTATPTGATPTATRTPTGGSPTPSRTGTDTLTPTETRTPTITKTPTITATPSTTRTSSFTATVTRTATATRTATVTLVPTDTRTPTITRTVTRTRTETLTPTVTLTPTSTRTATPTVPRPVGPEVTYFGIAAADNTVRTPIGQTDDGVPIFDFPNSFGFIIVVEGRPGTNNRPLGQCGVMGTGPCANGRAAVQVIASRKLGDGSPAVCDVTAPNIGGVPAVPSLSFDASQTVSDAIDDLACRFDIHATSVTACTNDERGNPAYVRDRATDPVKSSLQYCSAPVVGSELALQHGLTRLKVQIQDATTAGTVGNQAQIAISVP